MDPPTYKPDRLWVPEVVVRLSLETCVHLCKVNSTKLSVYLAGCHSSGPLYFSCRRWHFGKFLISFWYLFCGLVHLLQLSVNSAGSWTNKRSSSNCHKVLKVLLEMTLRWPCYMWSLLLCFSRTCMLPWSALRTCSPDPTRGWTVPVLWSVPRRASSTPTPCCPGRCCSRSAPPTSSKTSCASKIGRRQPFNRVSRLCLWASPLPHITLFQHRRALRNVRNTAYVVECMRFVMQTPA